MTRHVIYDDDTYHITSAIIATPRRFYPIANTTARIRRDPLWMGLGIAGFVAASFAVYADLLLPVELATLAAIAALALMIGFQVSILSIDAMGHDKAMIVGRTKKIKALYTAIRDPRTANFQRFRSSVATQKQLIKE